MTRLLTKHIATMTEMREPHKVLAAAGDNPVAVMKNSRCVGYFVPSSIVRTEDPVYATREEVLAALTRTRNEVEPVLEYLREK